MQEVRITKLKGVRNESLCSPHSVCLMEDCKRLAVIDRSAGKVCKTIDLTTNEPLFSFGDYGLGRGEFSYPIDVERIGSLLAVADYLRIVIVLFSLEGDFVSEVELSCFADLRTFSEDKLRPWSLSYSDLSSNLYGCFLLANAIFRFSSDKPCRYTFGRNVLKQPLGICVGGNENVFVIDKTTCVTRFQEDGGVLARIEFNKIDSWCSETIVRFALDLTGNFILCPSSLNLILVFSPKGEQLFPLGAKDRSIFSLDNPLDVTLSRSGALLAVSDTYHGVIELFNYSCD